MSSWVGRRLLAGVVVASAAAVVTAGVARADVDRVDSFVDGSANTITVTQSDTYVSGVVPLDGSPLTREWFHNGRITVAASGAEAADFSGTVSVGYQVAYPMSIGGSVNISFDTPQATAKIKQKSETVEPAEGSEAGPTTTTTTTIDGDLTVTSPQIGSELSIAPGPGIQEIEIASADVAGELSELQFAGIHGTATGVLGNVTIRPYVKVTSSSGSSVVSYGSPHSLG